MAKILLAEDDDAMRQFLARSLQKAGHEVAAVGNGLEALPMMAEEDFELLIADIVMPGMDGLELARRASREIPGIRVIFITGFAAVAMNARNFNAPNTKVLSKPFHLRALIDEVTRTLAA